MSWCATIAWPLLRCYTETFNCKLNWRQELYTCIRFVNMHRHVRGTFLLLIEYIYYLSRFFIHSDIWNSRNELFTLPVTVWCSLHKLHVHVHYTCTALSLHEYPPIKMCFSHSNHILAIYFHHFALLFSSILIKDIFQPSKGYKDGHFMV